MSHKYRGSIFPTEDLQELWRPAPEFAGPMLPPMIAWQLRGEPKSPWQIASDERAERERQAARTDERQMSLAL